MKILIFCAMYPEAEPLIRGLGLKKINGKLPFQQFTASKYEKSREILLTVTGTGMVSAACAVSSVLAEEVENEGTENCVAVLFGCAAEEKGTLAVSFDFVTGGSGIKRPDQEASGEKHSSLYRGVKLKNLGAEKDFYPDPLAITGPVPAVIETASSVWKKGTDEETEAPEGIDGVTDLSGTAENQNGLPVLHDMEAAAFFEAASHFLSPDRIQVLKFVSDSGEAAGITAADIRRDAECVSAEAINAIRCLADFYAERCDSAPQENHFNAEENAEDRVTVRKQSPERERRICESLHASISMREEIKKLIHYADLFDGDVLSEAWQELTSEEIVPCRDRKTGKDALMKLRKAIVQRAFLNASAYAPDADKNNSASAVNISPDRVIYVEEQAFCYPKTQKILQHYPDALVIPIRHYKDIFNRRRQDAVLQRKEKILILAVQNGQKIFPGAPVCQDFGNKWFYYSSFAINCPFDCEYCYLKGMYQSGYTVLFVNTEDFFEETDRLLSEHPVYPSASYDTDLMAIENTAGYVSDWVKFASSRRNLSVEIRTKAGNSAVYAALAEKTGDISPAESGVIFAFTLSPDAAVHRYEHHTPSAEARIRAAQAAMQAGFSVRLCFDPVICFPNWQESYRELISRTAKSIDLTKVLDFSVGSFRISGEYMKNMRKAEPDSDIVWYPFEITDGYYHYPEKTADQMEQYIISLLEAYVSADKIF